MVQILYQTRSAEALLNPSLGSLKSGVKSLCSLQTLLSSHRWCQVAEQLLEIFYLFYFYWGLEQPLLMFRILSSTVLNVTTPTHWSPHPQCRGDGISQVSFPAWSESQAHSKPAPALSCQTPSSAKTLSSNLLLPI